jgi:hypothetical protein
MTSEYFETGSKKGGRGMARRSLDLIGAMYAAAARANTITGRGIGYKLFVAKLIESMATGEMQKVYQLMKEARERGIIPWHWIVDETRAIQRVSTWSNPAEYAECAAHSYRRNFWDQQPHRVLIVSEKGTVRGLVRPVLDEYAVGFFPVHGFTSATAAHDLAMDNDGRDLILLYIGDFDPSGMFMSEADLPKRFAEYGGGHIKLKRIALTREQVRGLPSFPASDKRKDPRRWFVANHGERCWEIDAMDPNDLRDCVEREIKQLIEPVAWGRCEVVNKAEQASLKTIIEKWGARDAQPRMRKPRPVSAADAERQPHAAASGPTVQGAQMER